MQSIGNNLYENIYFLHRPEKAIEIENSLYKISWLNILRIINI